MQWYWLQDVFPGVDQWNSLHEQLVDRWKLLWDILPSNELHSRCPVRADWRGPITTTYMQETAAEAGFETVRADNRGHRLGHRAGTLRRLEEAPITCDVQAPPLGVGAGRRVRATRGVEPTENRCGSSPCGKRCSRTRRFWRCCGRCTPGTRTCYPPTSTTPMSSPSTFANPSSGGKVANITIVGPAWSGHRRYIWRRGLRLPTLRPTAGFRRLRPALGAWWSAIRPRAWASARPQGW